MTRKLVSVVTGTWQRHDLLLEAIENVREQTYRPLEHVIVSDGPDPELAFSLNSDGLWNPVEDRWCPYGPDDVPIRFAELGFWSSGLLTDSVSAAPFMVAQLLARGDYQMWLADDERMLVPDHIERLVDLLEEYDADFAYPKVRCYREPPSTWDMEIGTNPPRQGQFTHCLYRRDMLNHGALFRVHVGSGTDWDTCARMMAARPGGRPTRWVFLPETTLSHRVDK